jgi:hypothetical protein
MSKKTQENKKIPDYARKDIVGVYYSQMKLWQGIAFILGIVSVFLAYHSVFQVKYKYFFTDGYQVVALKEANPKVDSFLNVAVKKLFTFSYLDFDKNLASLKDYLSEETYNLLYNSLSTLKPTFESEKRIWIPTSPTITLSQKNGKILFSADLKVREVIVSRGVEAEKQVVLAGEIVQSEPTGENLFPFKIKSLKVNFIGG